MSYPQPDADQYAIKGYKYFRLLTPLTSPGDIYESQQSGHALALGPESDVANVDIAYFDDQVTSFVNRTQIGPLRSFVGRIDARNDARYVPSGRPGRVLIWPADLYDPSYVPADFVPDTQSITFVTPMLDVIQYFSPQDSLVPRRNDKTYRFNGIPNDGVQGWIILPFWGRRTATIRLTNGTAGLGAVLTGVRGVNYFVNDGTSAVERQIVALTPTPAGLNNGRDLIMTTNAPDLSVGVIHVDTDGRFDALAIFIDTTGNTGPVVVNVTVSDSG